MTNPVPCCKQCMFSRMDSAGTTRICCESSPQPAVSQSSVTPKAVWPEVLDTDWCGEGYDQINGHYGPGGWH